MSGVTYYIPVSEQLEFFKEILGGKLSKVGLVFDENSRSRRVEIGEFKSTTKKMGISCEIELIGKKDALTGAVKKLIDKGVEAIVLTSSGLLYENVGMILDMCTANKIPVFWLLI